MDKPKLLVIAGCNGSGKSSFSKAFTPSNIVSYDYDKTYKKYYDSLILTDISDRMAHNLTRSDLEKSIENAIQTRTDFCYETNFNSTPLYWPKQFKDAGYTIEMVFFCLDSISKAKERVRIRYENGGHFVPDREVEERYRLGYTHLNEHWNYFDAVSLFDTSTYNAIPRHVLTMTQKNIIVLHEFPSYLEKLIPAIYNSI